MRRTTTTTGIAAIWLVFFIAADAQAASPRLKRILPGGIQRGVESELILEGERIHDAEEILFFDPGFEVLGFEPLDEVPTIAVRDPIKINDDDEDEEKKKIIEWQWVRARVKVAADCRLGEHLAHLRCVSGVTEFRTFFVEPYPSVAELEPNNTPDQSQAIGLNVCVGGVVRADDRDCFAVNVKQGQRLNIEVVAMRLGTAVFDAHLELRDSTRRLVASAKGSAFGVQDGIISYVAPDDGTYYVSIQGDDGSGSDVSTYRLHVGTFPRPTAVYPPGGKLGEVVSVRMIGDIGGDFNQHVQLPTSPDINYVIEPTNQDGAAPTPIPFRLFPHANALEAEPNETLESATRVDIPAAFNGIIQRPGDVDHFRFTAEEGQEFDVECYARRLRSPLDPVLQLFDAEGNKLLENDDGGKVTDNEDAELRGADSYFRFKVPADGEYVLKMADLLRGGSPTYVYRVEISPVKPWLLVRLPRVQDSRELYGQYRQQIFVARGNYFGGVVLARRKDHRGDVEIVTPDLPKGVTIETMTIPAGGDSVPVVFHADAEAELAGSLVALAGRDPDLSTNVYGAFRNQADLLLARPGLNRLTIKATSRVPVVVTEQIPFRLEIPQENVTLVRGGEVEVPVRVHREPGFDGDIVLTMPFLPRNVGTSANVQVPGDQNEAVFTVNAKANTAPLEWKFFVLGSSGEENTMWASTPLVPLKIAKRFVTVELHEKTFRQGDSAKIDGTIHPITPFDGTAVAELRGLPNGVTSEAVEFDQTARRISFDVQTVESAPVGKHAGVTCHVTVRRDSKMLVARAGQGVLRIEAAKADQQVAVESRQSEPTNDAPTDAKPLTRLGRLRLEAKQRAGARVVGKRERSELPAED